MKGESNIICCPGCGNVRGTKGDPDQLSLYDRLCHSCVNRMYYKQLKKIRTSQKGGLNV